MEANTPGGCDKCVGTTSTPGQNRTGDLAFRKRLLYPTELRGHCISAARPSAPAVNNMPGYRVQTKIAAQPSPRATAGRFTEPVYTSIASIWLTLKSARTSSGVSRL